MKPEATPTGKEKYLSIDGHRMHYTDEGRGETLLFVHGIPEHAGMFRKLTAQLVPGARCIVPDHLGFGRSEKAAGALLTPEGHAARLLAFVKALQLHNIHLVVHDLGGPIGLGVLVSAPELFRSVTITNTFLWSLEQSSGAKALKMMQGGLGKWLYLKMGFSVKFMARNGFADKAVFKEHYEDFMRYHKTAEERYANYRLMLSMMTESGWFDETLQKLKQTKIPGQIVWGMKDKFFTPAEYLGRWMQELPAFPVHAMEGSGHFPHLEAPGELAGHLKNFIAGLKYG